MCVCSFSCLLVWLSEYVQTWVCLTPSVRLYFGLLWQWCWMVDAAVRAWCCVGKQEGDRLRKDRVATGAASTHRLTSALFVLCLWHLAVAVRVNAHLETLLMCYSCRALSKRLLVVWTGNYYYLRSWLVHLHKAGKILINNELVSTVKCQKICDLAGLEERLT